MRLTQVKRAGESILAFYSNGERYVFTEAPAIISARRGYIEGMYQANRIRYVASLGREISLVQIMNREAVLLARKSLDDMGFRDVTLCRSKKPPRIGTAIVKWRGFPFTLDITICAPISAPLSWRVLRMLLPVTYRGFAICIEPVVPPPLGRTRTVRFNAVKELGRISILRFDGPALVVVKKLGLYFYSVGRIINADIEGGVYMEVYEPTCVDLGTGQMGRYMGLVRRGRRSMLI